MFALKPVDVVEKLNSPQGVIWVGQRVIIGEDGKQTLKPIWIIDKHPIAYEAERNKKPRKKVNKTFGKNKRKK